MTGTTTDLSDGAHRALIRTLDAYHHTDSSDALAGEGDDTDSIAVLRRLLESDKFSSEQELKLGVAQYTEGRPLAYITVYIPRVETEQWVMLLGQRIYETISAPLPTSPSSSSPSSASPYSRGRPFRILDICSGSGCIPLLLASLGRGLVHVVGLDVDDRALAVARENVQRNGLQDVARFEKFDLFDDTPKAMEQLRNKVRIEGREGFGFDMVVSNPPYVSSEDMRKVEKTWFEGKFALQGKLRRTSQLSTGADNERRVPSSSNAHSTNGTNGDTAAAAEQENDEAVQDGDDGYSFYRRIQHLYSAFLDPATPASAASVLQSLPKLVLEVGAKQSGPVQEMYVNEGRLEVTKETERRREVGAPKLEEGDMVGTERSVWVYRQ